MAGSSAARSLLFPFGIRAFWCARATPPTFGHLVLGPLARAHVTPCEPSGLGCSWAQKAGIPGIIWGLASHVIAQDTFLTRKHGGECVASKTGPKTHPNPPNCKQQASNVTFGSCLERKSDIAAETGITCKAGSYFEKNLDIAKPAARPQNKARRKAQTRAVSSRKENGYSSNITGIKKRRPKLGQVLTVPERKEIGHSSNIAGSKPL